jgi:hypothetical protein
MSSHIDMVMKICRSGETMDNFATILAICRMAFRDSSAIAERQISKLRDALRAEGADDQAAALDDVLLGKVSSGELRPSRVVTSGTATMERMLRSVRPPVDKESGAPLATIYFPADFEGEAEPILNVGLQSAIDALVEEWQHSAALANAGIRPPLSFLIYGQPGTGKTRLAHVIAARMQVPLVSARLDGLISSFLGTTARNIANLFEFVNRYDCILLLDEFDAVAKVRDDPHEIGEIKRVVNTLLQCLDGRRDIGFTIAITNHEHLLDSAIWRRFDSRVHVPLPDFQTRSEIVRRYLSGVEVDPVDVEFIAWLSDGRSGAEIETVCSALKRYLVMNGTDRRSVLAGLRVNVLLSADHSDSSRNDAFGGSDEQLARILFTDREAKFTQESLARLFDAHQSTISRWIRK